MQKRWKKYLLIFLVLLVPCTMAAYYGQGLGPNDNVIFKAITGNGVLTVNPDGTNETLQVNDGSIDFTDGNAGTTGTLTIDATGNWSYNKNIGIGTTSPVLRTEISAPYGAPATTGTVPNGNFALTSPDVYSSLYIGIHSSVGASHYAPWIQAADRNALGTYGSLLLNPNGGNVGIGTTAPNQKLTIEGTMSLKEQAAANADVATYGQIWVANSTPNELWFTDDFGTDTQLSSHPLDAPSALYINGPGLDWIGKRVQKYLGVIFWQTLDGTITKETFEAYNLRRKDVPGHIDLVKRDRDTVELAKLRAKKLAEVIEEEVNPADAFEEVEITEQVQTGTKSEGFAYVVDKDGKVAVTEKTIPIMTKQGTGKFEKRLKAGISFDEKTGKFINKRTLTKAEVDAMQLKAPKMPSWMKTWLEAK